MKSDSLADVIVVTATDAAYFAMSVGLVLSIRAATTPNVPAIGVLDLGLTQEQLAVLGGLGVVVRAPDWDYELPGSSQRYPAYFKAMTARPHLPKYFPEHTVIVWIDSDAWVQDWQCLVRLIEASRGDRLAIVRERFNAGDGVSLPLQTPEGVKRFRFTVDTITSNVTKCYRQGFGEGIAKALGREPSYNSGVFALERDSRFWSVWSAWLKRGLAGGFHHLIEQQALNVAIHEGEIEVQALPWETNFVCVHALPEVDLERHRLMTPGPDSAVIGVLHLTDAKNSAPVPLRIQNTDRTVAVWLHYLRWISTKLTP
jgi:hypothetical protein